MAYQIVKTLMEKKPDLVAVHAEAHEHRRSRTRRSAAPMPWHPGAKKYFEEQGVKVAN